MSVPKKVRFILKEQLEDIHHGLLLIAKKINQIRDLSKERGVIKKLAKIGYELKEFAENIHTYKIEYLQLNRPKGDGK